MVLICHPVGGPSTYWGSSVTAPTSLTTPTSTIDAPAIGRRLTPHRAWLLTAAALGVVLLIGTRAAWFFVIDDAYITFRYSDHLAAGNGPVWNVGEDPVEGFTNFLWMLWHTPFAWLGLDLPVVAKLTSLAAAALTLGMLVRLCWQRGGIVAALTAGGAFVLFLPTYFHITSGLETVAFAALVLRIVITGLHALDGRGVRTWEPPLLLVAAGMLRPEGVLAALPAFAIWLWLRRRDRAAWAWTAGAALVGAGYFGWRWSYYGHLFPNTFYVKFGNVTAGARWLEVTVQVLAPMLALTLLLVARRATRGAGLLLTATVATTYLTYVVSGPTMDYLYRFAYHAFPVLCLAAGLAAGSIGRRWLGIGVGAVAAGWVAVTGVQAPDLTTIVNYGPDLSRAHVAIGHGLADVDIPAEDRTIALHDAGAIPYYSGWTTLDYIGLNDEAIAHGADPTTAVVDDHATVFIVRSSVPAPPGTAFGVHVPTATEGYQRIAVVPMRANYYLNVYVLPERADEVRGPLLAAVGRAQATYDPGRLELTVDRWLDRLRHDFPW